MLRGDGDASPAVLGLRNTRPSSRLVTALEEFSAVGTGWASIRMMCPTDGTGRRVRYVTR